MTTILTKVNDYFFDVDPDEPIDWTSALAFYGTCLFGLFTSVVFAVLTVIG